MGRISFDPNENRASMFQPFNALEGLEDLIKAQERIVVPLPELTEDDYAEMNDAIHQIQKGMMVKVVYLENQECVELQGMVSKINLETKIIQIVKTKIDFKKLRYIKILEEQNW